jgi:hypothetical protein
MVIENIFVDEDSAQLNCMHIFICSLKCVDLKYIAFFYCFMILYPSNFRYVCVDAESAQFKAEFLWV